MDIATVLYLGVTFGLFAIFLFIVMRTFSSKRKDKMEAPKYRMLDKDD